MSKAKSALKPHKRGFHLIFQIGGPTFFAFFGSFSRCQMCRSFLLLNIQINESPKRSKINPSKYKGVVRPFLERPGWLTGACIVS